MSDTHRENVAWAQFVALLNDQPTWWDEHEVARFHEIVTELEEGFAVDLSAFRIPDSEVKQSVDSAQRAPRSGRFPGRKHLSPKRHCDEQFARHQIEGIMLYFQSLQPSAQRQKIGFVE
jgi:predicted glycoside hydrolase/deacetylase ChbG (UPF0249 family)